MVVKQNASYCRDIQGRDSLRGIMLLGLILRIAFCVILFTIGRSIAEPYFISDDIKYEEITKIYLSYASSPIDFDAFRRCGAAGYLQVFWPWVMCVSAYVFRTIYAGRMVNVVLSVLCIEQIYRVTYKICNDQKPALMAAKLFAFLPITVMTCCFPIKDIFLTYSTLVFFGMILDIQNGYRIRFINAVWCVSLLIGTYFTRGALVELYSIFVFVYLFHWAYKAQRLGWLLFLVAAGCGLILVFGNAVIASFTTKVDVYGDYGTENMGGIALVRINSWRDFYKLPFTYFFAMLQPIKMKLLTISTGSGFWLSIMGLLNVSIYPVAIGSLIYMFVRKHNFLFWLSSFVLYAAIISLSLGIFRHYLFLIPLEMINFSLVRQYEDRNITLAVWLGSIGLLCALLLYSAL